MELYPLKEKKPDFIKSHSGKRLDEITIEGVMSGEIKAEDIKISKEVLILQAEIARRDHKIALAKNFIRASELIEVPDDLILSIYNQLRPYRSTETELLALEKLLRNTYDATMNADLVHETLEVYKKRDLLKE